MVNYRRNYIEGGTYFFTVTLQNRQSSVLTENIDFLRKSFKVSLSKAPAIINAIVILPDHLHTIMTLPNDDADYPRRWQVIKSEFTKLLKKNGHHLKKDQQGEHNLWQRRYWEHTITNSLDYQRHVDYIHYNPVKHGLVECVKDWPYSSFHRYVRDGLLQDSWGENFVEEGSRYGE